MNNILLNILNLRSKFTESANYSQQMISGLIGDENSLITGTITDGLNRALSVQQDGENYIINIIDNTKTELLETTFFTGSISQYKSVINDYILGNASELVQYPGFDLKQFIVSATAGAEMNSMVGALLDKFSYTSRVKTADLTNLISTYNIDGMEKREFINALNSSSTEDGYVSNYTLLQILKTLSGAGKESVDQGSMSIDDSEIFYLKNFLATAVVSILSTLVTVLGMVLTAVNAVLGFIVSAIGAVFSAITNAISNAVNNEVQVKNPLSTTNWFDGPVIAGIYDSNWPLSTLHFKNTSFYSYDQVTISRFGNLDFAHFPQEDGLKLYMNGFISSNLARDKAWDYVSSIFHIDGLNTANPENPVTISLTGTPYLQENVITFPPSCYLNDEEDAIVKGMGQRTISNYQINCLGATLMLWFANIIYASGSSITFTLSNIGASWHSKVDDICAYAVEHKRPGLYALFKGLRIFVQVDYNHRQDPSQGWLADWANDQLTVIATDLRNIWSQNRVMNPNNYNPVTVAETSDTFANIAQSVSFNITGSVYCYNSPLARMYRRIVQGSDAIYYWTSDIGRLSGVPTDRCFEFASFSESGLIWTAAITASIIAVVLAGACIAKSVYRKHKWNKMMSRKQALMQAKDDWDDGLISTDEFYKEQKKYNFKAKIFGWDSYDAANGWWNSAEESSSDTSFMDLRKLISGR